MARWYCGCAETFSTTCTTRRMLFRLFFLFFPTAPDRSVAADRSRAGCSGSPSAWRSAPGAVRRRRARDQAVAERAPENHLPAEHDPDWEILHEEILDLPERLRAPVVLCHLQGLTYAVAASRLEVSEATIRGRLDRARNRLRRRLIRRGVTIPAGLFLAGVASETQAALPASLIRSTIGIALGFIAGNTAARLARGVLNSMLLHQVKVATALLCLGIGGSYWAWRAVAAAMISGAQTNPGSTVVRAPAPAQSPRTDLYGDPLPPGAAMRLGTVRYRQGANFRRILYSSDGQLVVSASHDVGERHGLVVRDARNANKLREIDLDIGETQDFAFAPDGKTIAAVGFQIEPKRNVLRNDLVFADVATGRVISSKTWDDDLGVDDVAYAADGKLVVTMGRDETVRIWDVATKELQFQQRIRRENLREHNHRSIAFSPNPSSHLLAIGWEQSVDLRDVDRHHLAQRIAVDGGLERAVFSPDGTTLAAAVSVASRDRTNGVEIRLWRVTDGTEIGSFKSQRGAQVSHMSFSLDGKVLAATGFNSPLISFDTATGKELNLLSSITLVDAPLAFSPDGRTLATTGDGQVLHFWDMTTGKDRLATPDAHVSGVTALACLADGKTLVSGSWDRTVRAWDLVTGRQIRILPQDSSVEARLTLLRRLTSGHAGSRLSSWEDGSGRGVESQDRGASAYLEVREDRATMGLFAGRDPEQRQRVSDRRLSRRLPPALESRKRRRASDREPKLERPPSNGGPAFFSRDGRSVAMIREYLVRVENSVRVYENSVQVFDVATGERRFKEAPVGRVCEFAPGGESLAIVKEAPGKRLRVGSWQGTSSPTSTVVWLDGQTGRVRREIEIPDCGVMSLAFSPDEQAIAAGTYSGHPARGVIHIFRLRDKREIQTIESPCPHIYALTFTPDGKQIVAGLQDTSIVIWDVRSTDDTSKTKAP